jgi:Retrotransposon gag protein
MSNQEPIYTPHGLAEQVQDPNFDVRQVLVHLANNMDGLNQLQQQFNGLQAHIQAQATPVANQPNPEALHTIASSLEALAAHGLEQQQMHRNFNDSVTLIMTRLAQRGHGRAPIPPVLSPKFKGDDTLTVDEFKSKLTMTIERYEESLATDRDQVRFAIQSMEGPPALYFAPFVNQIVPDDEGILEDYSKFLNHLENVFGDQHNLDELNAKLGQLRQHPGTMVEYISKFRNLAGRVGWNEAALVARFKDGLSSEVKSLMAPQWHALRTLSDTMTSASTAYQNTLFQQKNRPRPSLSKNNLLPQSLRSRPTPIASSSPAPSPMDLDNVRAKKLTATEKQHRRDNGLCMYCGGGNHFAASCPKKIQLAAVITDGESENEMV